MPRRSIYDDIVQLLTWAHQKTLVLRPSSARTMASSRAF
jgi:hypothetical protein